MGAHNSVVGADQGFRAPSGDQESVRDSVHEDSASAPIDERTPDRQRRTCQQQAPTRQVFEHLAATPKPVNGPVDARLRIRRSRCADVHDDGPLLRRRGGAPTPHRTPPACPGAEPRWLALARRRSSTTPQHTTATRSSTGPGRGPVPLWRSWPAGAESPHGSTPTASDAADVHRNRHRREPPSLRRWMRARCVSIIAVSPVAWLSRTPASKVPAFRSSAPSTPRPAARRGRS